MTHNPAEVLREAAETFRLYQNLHLAKAPPDILKAERNRQMAEKCEAALRAVLAPPATADGEAFQQRVAPWMQACFGPEISADRLERSDRLLEEVFELLQQGGYPRERIRALEGYVYGRPPGEAHQEVGGVMVTLAAYCLAHDLDMHKAAEDELARIWTKVEKIRAKQAAKPTGSALPVAVTTPPVPDVAKVVEVVTTGLRSAAHYVRNNALDMERDYPEIVKAEESLGDLAALLESLSAEKGRLTEAPKQHTWVTSTLGHGEQMCSDCYITNREAVVLGLLNRCDSKD